MSAYLPADLHAEHVAKIAPLVEALHGALNDAAQAALHQDGPLLLAIAIRKADSLFAQLEAVLSLMSQHYQNLETMNLNLWRQREELQARYEGLKAQIDIGADSA